MKIVKWIKENRWILNWKYWNMLYPYHEDVDLFLQNIMNDEKTRTKFLRNLENPENMMSDNRFYMDLENNYTIWLTNYPYAYAVFQSREGQNLRGSRKTVMQFKIFMDTRREVFPEYFL